jgi:arsenate reductase (glutaredoxin)
MKIYGYKKCSTCRKAEKWLESKEKGAEFIDITLNPPTEAELTEYIANSGLEIKKFFNTAGVSYREGKFKDKIKDASQETMIKWLAADGRLIKRPIVVDNLCVSVGFKEEDFEEKWSN